MRKKPVIQPQDKYVLRMPDGLRDRIKAYAERQGTSMNHEIIRILEIEFPEQRPVEEWLGELGEMLSVLTAGSKDPRFVEFSDKLEETILGIISGKVTGVDAEVRSAVSAMWGEYKERQYHDAVDQESDALMGRTEEEIDAYEITGKFEKYAAPAPRKPNRLTDSIFISNVVPPLSLSAIAEKIEAGDLEGAAEIVRKIPKSELEKNLRFERLPESEKDRLRGEEPPPSGDNPFPKRDQ